MKGKFTLLLTLIGLTVGAQTDWTQLKEFTGGKRFGAMDFVVDNNAYIVGGVIRKGTSYIAYDEVMKYNHAKDTWVVVSSCPLGKVYGGVAFVINEIVYVGLGSDQNGSQSRQFWAYNTETDKWTRKADFPGSSRVFSFTFTTTKYGYVGTGLNASNQILSDFWQYDPSNDKWAKKAMFPGGSRLGAAGFSSSGNGYAGMGDDGNFYYNDFYKYDEDNDTWEEIASFPGNNRTFASTCSANDIGFVIGGEKGSFSFTDQMWFYNAKFDYWVQERSFKGLTRGYANLFYVNDAFHYALGITGNSDNQSDTEVWKLEVQPVGLESITHNPNVKVYPNPSVGEFKLDLNGDSQISSIRIIDLQGRVVFKKSVESTDSIVLNPELKSGVYLLNVEDRNNRLVTRIQVL